MTLEIMMNCLQGLGYLAAALILVLAASDVFCNTLHRN